MHKPVVFLDSSVLIAALLSGQGGSAYVLTQNYQNLFPKMMLLSLPLL